MQGSDDKTVCVIACGALAREILAVVAANGLDHVELRCLDAKLHNRPDRIPAAVAAAIEEARADGFADILVGYADCGTGGRLDAVLEAEGVSRIGGPHCYAFFAGTERFLADYGDECRAFFLTDFLARQFDSIIYRPLGLDRHPELRDMYFGNYEKVVYLAQTEDAELDRRARAAADRLGLAFEKRHTGYGELADFIARA